VTLFRVTYRHRASLIAFLTLIQWEIPHATVAGTTTTPAQYSRAEGAICAHALLFEGRHRIGTHAGAIAVARDIRASTHRRLRRVAKLPVPTDERRPVRRWLVLERRLAHLYAGTYVRIFDVVAAATTPVKRTQAVKRLNRLVHAPDRLQRTVVRLESRLRVADCTGGIPRGTRGPPAIAPSL
jgi:hypothetical protein